MSAVSGRGGDRSPPPPAPGPLAWGAEVGSTTTRLLPGDNPQAYLPGDRRRALARGESLPQQTTGSALFVDISGFTPLTEALAAELGGRRGAEELTATLDRVFSALLERLHVWRGSVIYFSGDAVTAWLDGDDGLAAVACALEMQTVMDDVGLVRHAARSGGAARGQDRGRDRLGPPVRRRRPRRPAHRRARRRGSPTPSPTAEQVAEPGDVVVDAGTLASLGEPPRGGRGAAGRATDRSGSSRRLTVATSDPGAPEEPPVLAEELVRPWVLPPVWDRMVAGRGELLAELRPAVPVFVRFGGLDFDADPTAPRAPGPLRAPDPTGLRQRTAATSSSSPSATRAPTCTPSSAPRWPTRTTRPAPAPPRSTCSPTTSR